MARPRKTVPMADVLQRVLNMPVPTEVYRDIPTGQLEPRTIRPDARTVAYFEHIGEQLGGISWQALTTMVLNAVASEALAPVQQQAQVVHERFHLVFSSHGIPLIHIPRVLEKIGCSGFPLAAVENPEVLYQAMTPPLIHAIAKTFHVSEAWLSGDMATPVDMTGEHEGVGDDETLLAVIPAAGEGCCHLVATRLFEVDQYLRVSTYRPVKGDASQGEVKSVSTAAHAQLTAGALPAAILSV